MLWRKRPACSFCGKSERELAKLEERRVDLQQRAEMLGARKFLGVPIKDFEVGGRELLCYLLAAGLNPDSRGPRRTASRSVGSDP